MPLCKCPRCKAIHTVQVHDVKAWHTQNWPGYAPTELVPEVCPSCKDKEERHRLETEAPK